MICQKLKSYRGFKSHFVLISIKLIKSLIKMEILLTITIECNQMLKHLAKVIQAARTKVETKTSYPSIFRTLLSHSNLIIQIIQFQGISTALTLWVREKIMRRQGREKWARGSLFIRDWMTNTSSLAKGCRIKSSCRSHINLIIRLLSIQAILSHKVKATFKFKKWVETTYKIFMIKHRWLRIWISEKG